jgi:hypothetical protein
MQPRTPKTQEPSSKLAEGLKFVALRSVQPGILKMQVPSSKLAAGL